VTGLKEQDHEKEMPLRQKRFLGQLFKKLNKQVPELYSMRRILNMTFTFSGGVQFQ
jgi:hypothetical protein